MNETILVNRTITVTVTTNESGQVIVTASEPELGTETYTLPLSYTSSDVTDALGKCAAQLISRL